MISVCELTGPYSVLHVDRSTYRERQFLANHLEDYERFNIAQPFYKIFFEAVQNQRNSVDQMRKEVVGFHAQVASLAYAEDPKKLEVAIASGEPLFNCFYNLLQEGAAPVGMFGFWQYIGYQEEGLDISRVIASIIASTKEALDQNNPIPLFQAVLSVYPYIPSYSLETLTAAVLKIANPPNQEIFCLLATGFFSTISHAPSFRPYHPESQSVRECCSCAVM